MILPLADLEPTGPFAPPRPAMRGRYRIIEPKKVVAIAALDALLALVPHRSPTAPARPASILVANWAHLGDVVTSLGAIAALRARYPGARIDMVVGTWGKPAAAQAGVADQLHVVDHWALDRSGRSPTEKRRRYRETRAQALRAIRAVGYEVAIDAYPTFPPAHPLFFRAGIPVRIGYTSGGFGPLLTHPVRWTNAPRPMADQYCDLLDRIDPSRPFAPGDLRPRCAPTTLGPRPAGLPSSAPYIVLHPGAGAAYKDWGPERWRALVRELRAAYPCMVPVVTGAGVSEVALAEELARVYPDIVSLAGRLDWEGFVAAIANAVLVVCPDTATGHVAALVGVPVVSLFTGTNSAAQWAPDGDEVQVLVRPVRCAPCNRPGCEAMACLRDVQVNHVMASIRRQLDTRQR